MTQYDPPSSSRRSWQFDPTVNLGHLLTTIAVVVTLVVWGVRLEGRVDQGDLRVEYLQSQLDNQRASLQASLDRIERLLERIADRLSRKADKPSAQVH